MKKIDRPQIGDIYKEMYLEDFEEMLPEIEEYLSNGVDNSAQLFSDGRNAVCSCFVLNIETQKTLSYLNLTKDLAIAHFKNAQNPEKEIELKVGDTSVVTKGIPTTAFTDPTFWCRCFYSAVMAGDKSAIDYLLDVPEELMKSANVKADEVDFAIVRFLKGLYQPKVDLGDLLMKALEASKPESNDSGRHFYLDNLKFPELNLYRLIFSKAPEEFNKELAFALERHKKFWTKGNLKNDPEGWISWPLVAACIIARESKDYPIEIESDYLPLWLIKREYE